MKKILLRTISIILFVLFALSLLLFLQTFAERGGGGFLDLTNVVRYFLVGTGVVTGGIGTITAILGWRSPKSDDGANEADTD